MKIRYYAETDSLYIELLAGPGTNVTVVNEDIRVDVDAAGRDYSGQAIHGFMPMLLAAVTK